MCCLQIAGIDTFALNIHLINIKFLIMSVHHFQVRLTEMQGNCSASFGNRQTLNRTFELVDLDLEVILAC